jgi:hypothetical protein
MLHNVGCAGSWSGYLERDMSSMWESQRGGSRLGLLLCADTSRVVVVHGLWWFSEVDNGAVDCPRNNLVTVVVGLL